MTLDTLSFSAILPDLVGSLAALAMITTFACNRMVRLRLAAIAANLLFIAYAAMLGLWPILLLHGILLPLNLWRLVVHCRASHAVRSRTGANAKITFSSRA